MTSSILRNAIICPCCLVEVKDFSPFPKLVVNLCNSCGNCWFDKGELALVLRTSADLPANARSIVELSCEKTQSDEVQSEKELKLPCPRCSGVFLRPWMLENERFHKCESCHGILIKLKMIQSHTIRVSDISAKPLMGSSIASQTERKNEYKNESLTVKESNPLDSRAITFWAMPMMFFAAGVVSFSGRFSVLEWLFSIPFHEFGHAFAAWLGGRSAVPIPYGFTWWGNQRCTSIIQIFIILWLLGVLAAYRTRSLTLAIIFASLFIFQLRMSFFITESQLEEIMIASGLAGEVILGCVLVGAFVYTLPKVLRWDFWRFPALFVGSILLSHSGVLWLGIKMGRLPIPWGSAMGGEGRNGDLQRLHDSFGWTENFIVKKYATVVILSLAWVVVHYVAGVMMELKRDRST